MKKTSWHSASALALLAAAMLSGCVGLAGVGIGSAVMSAEDRRSTGTQVDDEGLELRVTNRINERYGDKVHINVTAFNRFLLLTGEAPDAATKAEIEKIAYDLPLKPRGVFNEIRVAGNTTFLARSNDTIVTSKVKARFLDAGRFSVVHVKVVTEAAVVYLMGIVTAAEADAAVEIARTTGGVAKVIKVFENCTVADAVCRPREPAKSDAASPKAGS